MKPRSNMGRLDNALRNYGEAVGIAREYGAGSATGQVLFKQAAKQRKAIIERVRKLIRKGRVSSRVERGEK